MKVFELMSLLSCKHAGEEVVLYGYGNEFNADIEVVDYDKLGRVAISCNRKSFEQYDKKQCKGQNLKRKKDRGPKCYETKPATTEDGCDFAW